MASMIPPELIDEIFRNCSNDSLTKCALVNTTSLDLARAHLYHTIQASDELEYTMSCPSSMSIFVHTKHISFIRSYTPCIPFLREIYRLGRLETLTQASPLSWSQTSKSLVEAEEHLGMLLRIVSLSTIKRFRLYLPKSISLPVPKTLTALLFSLKLCDLSYDGATIQPRLLPLKRLDTLRVFKNHINWLTNRYPTLCRLSLRFHSPHDSLPTMKGLMKDWFALSSRQLTHLALDPGDNSPKYRGSNDASSRMITDRHEFPSLLSLTFQLHISDVQYQLEFLSLFFDQTDPNALFSPMIHIILRCVPKFSFHPKDISWKQIPQMVIEHFPQSRLFLYFDIPGSGVDSFVHSQSIVGVEGIYNIQHVSGGPFFSGEATDQCL